MKNFTLKTALDREIYLAQKLVKDSHGHKFYSYTFNFLDLYYNSLSSSTIDTIRAFGTNLVCDNCDIRIKYYCTSKSYYIFDSTDSELNCNERIIKNIIE